MIKTHVKFKTPNSSQFIKELRAAVNEYFEKKEISKYGNGSIVVKSILMVLVYSVPYILMLTGIIQSWPLILACWLIMGLGMAGIGMVLMHDANHGTFSKNRTLNRLLSNSLYLLGGFPATWQHQHNTQHHGFTNVDGQDEDINPAGILRFSPHKPKRKIHRFQQWYAWVLYGLMTLSWITAKDFRQMARYKKEEIFSSKKSTYTRLFIQLLVSKIAYYLFVLFLPMALLPVAWYWTLVFFLAMHLVSGFILSIIFQTAHVMPTSVYPLPDEQGYIDGNWTVHQLLTTTNYAPKSRVFSWMIGGLNYQVEHHLFPYISHVHYKPLSKIVREMAEKYELPYYVLPSFRIALNQHFKMLKALGA